MDYFEKRDNIEDVANEVTDQFLGLYSEIQEFYENKNVFVTDANGLGGLLAERLLRSCPTIRTIYLLMETEKSKLYQETCAEFSFSEDGEKTPDHLKKKVKIIHGNYKQPCCGISEIHQKIIKEEIQIVFHCSGSGNKHEKLKNLYYINVQSTKSLLEIASEMKKIEAFIYISTLNVNKFQSNVEKKLYEKIFSNNTKSFEEPLQVIVNKLVENSGEINDLTKAVAEKVLLEYEGKLPIAIARCSNDGCYQKDNVLNWQKLFNLSSTNLVLLTALKYHEHGIKEISIPTDNITNTLIAISWQIGRDKSNRNHMKIPVYDLIPNWESRIPAECEKHSTEDIKFIYSAISEQYQRNIKQDKNNKNLEHYQETVIYPAMFLFMLNLYLCIYANIYKLWNLFFKTNISFSTNSGHLDGCDYTTSNVDKLWSSLSNVDKTFFNFDIINNEKGQCSSRNVRNMMAYLNKDNLDILERDNANYVRYQHLKMYLKILLCIFGFSLYVALCGIQTLKLLNQSFL